ncbi:hypothetical protein [Antarctobacter sp.]|uniref:hypothetical protein n=1 Tax=Antarctobacter sp. TaxID=1872577 RepID=UPI003A92B1FA
MAYAAHADQVEGDPERGGEPRLGEVYGGLEIAEALLHFNLDALRDRPANNLSAGKRQLGLA